MLHTKRNGSLLSSCALVLALLGAGCESETDDPKPELDATQELEQIDDADLELADEENELDQDSVELEADAPSETDSADADLPDQADELPAEQ
ncbi:MAG: hypothetical protein RBU37_28200, partial [Myxococcota bacterium]|nr:hypothetical protein [Myxococcota bacterium]